MLMLKKQIKKQTINIRGVEVSDVKKDLFEYSNNILELLVSMMKQWLILLLMPGLIKLNT